MLFAQVARTHSFTQAAAVLGLPKSTVSRRIAQLEARLGQRLVERTTRRVALTEAGEAWAAQAGQVIVAVDEARRSLEALIDEPRGNLRLALPVDFATGWLAAPLASFAARYPAITLDLDLAPREVDVIGERFDAAIRIGALRDSSLTARKIASITRGICASPLYTAQRPKPRVPRALAQERWLDFPGRLSATHCLTLTGIKAGGKRREDIVTVPAIRANNVGMMRALTLAGAGVAVLPDVLCSVDVAAGHLVRLLPDWQAESTQATLVMPSRKFVALKTRLLIEHLQQQLG